VAVLGPGRTLAYYQEWDEALRRPALAGGSDQSRAKELIDVTATDSQSFLAVIHNTLHPDRSTRPAQATWRVRLAHWVVGGLLTALTLLVLGRRKIAAGRAELILLGNLVVLMILLSPVCHLHYFCLSLPLVMGLLVSTWESRSPRGLNAGIWVLLGMNLLANTLPHFPGLEALRDFGLAMYAALMLWLAGIAMVYQACPTLPAIVAEAPARGAAA